MYSMKATQIIRRARRSGLTVEAIAKRLGCTEQSIRNWSAKDDIAVNRAFSRELLRLQDDLRVAAKKAKKGAVK